MKEIRGGTSGNKYSFT